jgi:Tol biopolymer transport system component
VEPAQSPKASPAAEQRIPATKTYLAAAIMAAAALVMMRVWLGSDPTGAVSSHPAIPLVSERGIVRHPALSPDGARVAFSWAPEGAESLDLYVQDIDGAARKKLTADAESDSFPAWSPDGRSIAFYRKGEVLMIAAGGGPETRLTTGVPTGLSWSPDSKQVAVSDYVSTPGASAIFVVDVDSGERRNISKPKVPGQQDRWPAFSPDGTRVAFARENASGTEVYTARLDGGPPERVVRSLGTGRGLSGLIWSPEGDDLILAAGRLGLFSVPVYAHDAGDIDLVRIDIAGEDVQSLSMIRDPLTGHLHLAYGRERDDTDIVASSLVGGPLRPVAIQASNRRDASPGISPDGRRLAFVSQRSGTPEIWVSDADGSQAVRLTNFHSGAVGTPQWSPDSRAIAFDVPVDGNRDVYVVGSDSAQVRRLTGESSADGRPSWSRDGKWIYFTSDRSGRWQIWKMSVTGQNPIQVTRRGGDQAFESPDGTSLYYVKWPKGVWRVRVDGGVEAPVVEAARPNLWGVAVDGIYYFDLGDLAPPAFEFAHLWTLRKFDFASDKIVDLAAMRTSLDARMGSFAIRRDGAWLAWVTQPERPSELLLIRDLRVGPS